MAKQTVLNVPVQIFTDTLAVTGFIKVRGNIRHGLKKFIPRRISDYLQIAGERMNRAGEMDFIEVTKADVQDLKTGNIIKTSVRRIAINKNAIRAIIPIEVKPVPENP